MLEPAVVLFRLAQYSGATILFGSSLFFIYALPRNGPASAAQLRWPAGLVLWSAAALAVASALGLVAQTATMAGSLQDGLKLSSLRFVIEQTGLGRAAVIRTLAGALVVGFMLRGRPANLWTLGAVTGGIACISFGWMGHGATTDGLGAPIHLIGDIVHAVAAAAWVGALVPFAWLLWRAGEAPFEHQLTLYRALHGFAGIGSFLVGLILITGLMNSVFLVGVPGWRLMLTDPYGQLLSAKIVLFCAMIGLAASNRFRLTPALDAALKGASSPAAAISRLRASVLLETTAAFLVLALVAWLGALAPLSTR